MKIAIVGASGMVGRTFIKVLEEENIRADYYLFASANSAGKKMSVFGKEHTLLELNKTNVEKVKPDFALFSAGGDVSKEFAPVFIKLGCVVIDNSSAFRMEKDVPLVVPECNPKDIKPPLISNPNCSTIGSVVALKPLDDVYKLKRVIYTTYQAVSGAGQKGLDDLHAGMQASLDGGDIALKKFPYPIFNNLIPQIDIFLENGYTKEEQKMVNETRKILHKPNLPITATCVRVPIENAHSIAINAEFEKKPDIKHVKEILSKSPGIVLYDDPAKSIYPMPILASGRNEVFVGRIRSDESQPNTIHLFCVSDNVRKGAATNAVQILKLLLK